MAASVVYIAPSKAGHSGGGGQSIIGQIGDALNPLNPNWPFPPGQKAPAVLPGQPDLGQYVATPSIAGIEKAGVEVARDLLDPQWWLRVGEFAVGAILITVGIVKLTGAGQAARSGARTAERGSRVAYSVTPAGSRVNRAARGVARTARRSRA